MRIIVPIALLISQPGRFEDVVGKANILMKEQPGNVCCIDIGDAAGVCGKVAPSESRWGFDRKHLGFRPRAL